MMFLTNQVVSPEITRDWIELAKEEPAILVAGLVCFIAGSVLMYFLVRKGYIPTPDMTAKMQKLHDENMEIKIKMAHIEEELKHTREDSKKWQALLSSFLANRSEDLLDQAAKNNGGESE